MIFCPNCGANIDSKFLFCGKCGKMLKPDNELIIDGNKNNKLKHFLNKNISSFKRSALFFILWVLVLPLAIMIIFNRFNVSVSLCERLPETINQISHKIKYVKEGLSISYLSREITFIFDYILNIIYIVGSIFILLGVLFLLYPEALRKRLRRKAVWRLRRWFFAAALFFGALLVSVGWKQPGLLPKVLVLIGVAAILKGLLLLNSKATEKITAWVLSRPILHLRIFAVAEIAMGLLILLGLRA